MGEFLNIYQWLDGCDLHETKSLTRLCDCQKGHGGDQKGDHEQRDHARRQVVQLDGAEGVVAVDAVSRKEQRRVDEHGRREH